MPRVEIDGVGPVDVDAKPGTPAFDTAVDEISKKHGSPKTGQTPLTTSQKIGESSLDAARGLVQGFADIPFQVAKIGLAQQRLPEMVIQHFVPSWHPMQTAGEYVDQYEKLMNDKISGGGPKGYSTQIGPVQLSFQGVGQLASGAALPGAVFGKAAEGASFAGRMWGAVKGGAAFGAATSVPSVILAKDVKQANDRLIEAGVNIGISGLLAGAMHGSAEAVSSLFALRTKSGVMPEVKGGPGMPPTAEEAAEAAIKAALKKNPNLTRDDMWEIAHPFFEQTEHVVSKTVEKSRARTAGIKEGSILEGPWDEFGEHTGYRRAGAGAERLAQEPHLEITRGIEGMPSISAEEEAAIKASRVGIDPNYAKSPRERVADQVTEARKERLKHADQNERFIRLGKEYQELKATVDARAPEVAAQREVMRRLGKGSPEELAGDRDLWNKTKKAIDEIRKTDKKYDAYWSEDQTTRDTDRGYARLITDHFGELPPDVQEGWLRQPRALDQETGEMLSVAEHGLRGTHVFNLREGIEQQQFGVEDRRAVADMLRQHRKDTHRLNFLNAELEATAEVIASRGRFKGQLWHAAGDESIVSELQNNLLRKELTARIQQKQKALEGSNAEAVHDATNEPKNVSEIAVEFGKNVKEAGKLPSGPSDPREKGLRDEVLAERKTFVKRAMEAPEKVFTAVADAYRRTFDPMHQVPPSHQRAFDPMWQSDHMEMVGIPLLEKALKDNFTLEQRQLPALMNDPAGRARLHGISIADDMGFLLDSVRVAFNSMHSLGTRRGVISVEAFYEDFIPRVYAPRDVPHVMKFLRESGAFQGENPHSMERVFPNIFLASEKGWKTKSLDIAQLFPDYARSLNRTIVNNEIVGNLKAATPNNFRYLAEGEHLAGFKRAPEGLLGNAVVEDGVAKQLYIHEDDWRLINNLISSSKPSNGILKYNAAAKSIILSMDTYHWWQLQRGYAALQGWKAPFHITKMLSAPREGLAMLSPDSPNHPMVIEGMKGGLIPGGAEIQRVEFDKQMEKLASNDPSIAKLLKTLGTPVRKFSEHLWNEVAPGLTVMSYMKNLERLSKDPSMAGKPREELVRAAAKIANETMGAQSWRQFGRNKAVQETANLAFIAARWLETRFRMVGGAVGALAEIEAHNMDPYQKKLTMTPTTPEGKLYGQYALGYALQGIATAVLANTIIQAKWPEVKKFKDANGWINNATKIVFPSTDSNGRPLVMTPFPHAEYVLEFASDWKKFYDNRSSPAMHALLGLYTGLDYKGGKNRPESWSFETFLHVITDIAPMPMFYGTGGRVATSETPAYEAEKGLFRSLVLGLHNHPQYPAKLLDEEAFLKNDAVELKKLSSKNPILKAWYNMRIDRHNAKFQDWLKAVQETEGADKIASTIKKNQRQMTVSRLP